MERDGEEYFRGDIANKIEFYVAAQPDTFRGASSAGSALSFHQRTSGSSETHPRARAVPRCMRAV